MPQTRRRPRRKRDRMLDRYSGIAEVSPPDFFCGGAITISPELAEWLDDSEEEGEREIWQSWEGCRLAEPADWLEDSEEQREIEARQSWEGCRLAIRRKPWRGEAAGRYKIPSTDEGARAEEVWHDGGEGEKGNIYAVWARQDEERIRDLREQVVQLQELLVQVRESHAVVPDVLPLSYLDDALSLPPRPVLASENFTLPPSPPLLDSEDGAHSPLDSEDVALPPSPPLLDSEDVAHLPLDSEDVALPPPQPQPDTEDVALLPPQPGFEDIMPAPLLDFEDATHPPLDSEDLALPPPPPLFDVEDDAPMLSDEDAFPPPPPPLLDIEEVAYPPLDGEDFALPASLPLFGV